MSMISITIVSVLVEGKKMPNTQTQINSNGYMQLSASVQRQSTVRVPKEETQQTNNY